MLELLTLSRAARIAGISRSDLQKKLRSENTAMFEGKIRVSDLVNLFPDINLDHDPVFERVQQIKTEARPKSEYTDGWMPDPEVLLKRLKKMNSVLEKTKAALNDREQLLAEVVDRLRQRTGAGESSVSDLHAWLDSRLQQPAQEKDKLAEVFARNAFYKVLAPSVRISPSGHEFFVEGGDTILEAGLKAGFNLDYGCSSGNCGACKTRVLAGKVKQVRQSDYVISPSEKESGHILACSWTAVTDIVLEATEAKDPSDLPLQVIRAGISRNERLAPDLALLQLRTPRTRTLRFMAGQAIEIVDDEGNKARFSLASCPCDGRNLQLFIDENPDCPITRRVFDRDFSSQGVKIMGPIGEFVLRDDSDASAVFIAIEEGFAPIRSLIEHAISIDMQDSLTLLVTGWPDRAPHVNNLCRAWRDALDHFNYLPFPADFDPAAVETQLKSTIENLTGVDLYIAGPRASVSPVISRLLEIDGVSESQLQILITDELDQSRVATKPLLN